MQDWLQGSVTVQLMFRSNRRIYLSLFAIVLETLKGINWPVVNLYHSFYLHRHTRENILCKMALENKALSVSGKNCYSIPL